LRGLRKVGSDDKTYKRRTIDDYFGTTIKDNDKARHIFTGLEIYEELRKLKNGNREARQTLEEFEEFISKEFFKERKLSLIPRADSDLIYFDLEGDPEVAIHSIGDGLQTLIMLVFSCWLRRSEACLFFIEEPETFMHPGLQRRLVEILASPVFAKSIFFMTTHSNHLVDVAVSTNRASVFAFSRLEDDGSGVPHFRATRWGGSDASLLESLGVRASSVFLSCCTIWVEGITDRLYFRHYLDLYWKSIGETSFREDAHYSFVEYQGANVVHWAFGNTFSNDEKIAALRLSRNILLIMDEDEKKEERHAACEGELGERFLKLPCREVENLLSERVVAEIVGQYEEDRSNIHEWTERSNARYRRKYLGHFIDNHLLRDKTKSKRYKDMNELTNQGRKIKSRGPYSEKSGTIKDKGDFCHKALQVVKSYDDLTDDAKMVVERMVTFIKQMNRDTEFGRK